MATDTKQETQTWWRVSPGFGRGRIEPFPVVNETAKTVTYVHPNQRRPMRAAKVTTWDCWFPSEAEAVAFARQGLTEALSTARRVLESAETALAAFNAAHPLPLTTEQ